MRPIDCLSRSFCIFTDLFCALLSCKCHELSFGTLCTFVDLKFSILLLESFKVHMILPYICTLCSLCSRCIFLCMPFSGHCLRPIKDFNPVRSKLFYHLKVWEGGFSHPLLISGTIQSIVMKLCTAIVLLNVCQNTLKNFQKSVL